MHPDYIIIKAAPNVDIGDMAGERLDRNKTRFLETALSLYQCRMTPTSDLEVTEDGCIAQVFIVEKIN